MKSLFDALMHILDEEGNIQPHLLANSIFRNIPIHLIEDYLKQTREFNQLYEQVSLAGKILPENNDQVF